MTKKKMVAVDLGETTYIVPEDQAESYLRRGGIIMDSSNETFRRGVAAAAKLDEPEDEPAGKNDIWQKMYEAAKKEYHPEEISPFFQAHHVVAAVQSAATGKIYTGFCIEGASGVMDLCAERVAALNMYLNERNRVVRRMIAFRAEPPKVNGGMPCGACREFFMQFAYENRNMEIITDFKSRKTVKLKDLIPNWWGDKRYREK